MLEARLDRYRTALKQIHEVGKVGLTRPGKNEVLLLILSKADSALDL